VIGPRLILLPFALGLCFLAWSIRLLPPRDSLGALLRTILGLIFTAVATGGITEEVLIYRVLTGKQSLRGDSFFIAVMIAQCLIALGVVFKSDAALKRKETQSPTRIDPKELSNS
jgi:peptidoglycan/LPS O-acetylase OafA/YrhL